MNVLVIGAAGKTGEIVVERALAAGHQVTALVHHVGDYRPSSADVRIVEGDARNSDVLDKAMAEQDAVIDTVGSKQPYKETSLERSTAKAVIDAMKRNGVRRLAAVSALGVGRSTDQAGFFYEHVLMPTLLRGVLKDKAAMEIEIAASNIDYIIVRPAVLKDGEPTGNVHVYEHENKAHKVTRADLAQFLVDQLQNNAYVGRSITVAN